MRREEMTANLEVRPLRLIEAEVVCGHGWLLCQLLMILGIPQVLVIDEWLLFSVC